MARIVVFGASGNCGRTFVRCAAERGHDVTAVARAPLAEGAPRGARFVRGDVLDSAFVARVVPGHDVVVSALGMRYAHPWAERRSPDDFTERATANIVSAMKAAALERIVVISAAGVGDSRAAMNWPMRLMLKISNVGVAYADLERMEALLARSGLDWCAVRPVTLTHGEPTGRVRSTDRYAVTATIPRADVAAYLLHCVEDGAPDRTPMITAAPAARQRSSASSVASA